MYGHYKVLVAIFFSGEVILTSVVPWSVVLSERGDTTNVVLGDRSDQLHCLRLYTKTIPLPIVALKKLWAEWRNEQKISLF